MAETEAAISAWTGSAAMTELVRRFGGTPPQGPLDAVLDELESFSRVWDYRRGGVERAAAATVDYPDEVAGVVHDSALALGLAGRGQPDHSSYDHVLVLGGGPRTALARCHYAASLLAAGVRTDQVSALGSLRDLNAVERTSAARLGMSGVDTEADAMSAGLLPALHIDPSAGPALASRRDGVTTQGAPWWVSTCSADGRRVHVVAAATSDSARRADTADTLAGWAELVAKPARTDRLLLVTTDLFVPFQHCDAVRLLGLLYGCGVDTVGLDPRDFTSWLGPSEPSRVLQEVRSAIRSLRALYRALHASGSQAPCGANTQ